MTRRRFKAGALLAALAVAGVAAQPAAARPVPTATVRLLALNDFHGNLEPPSGGSGTAVTEDGASVPAGGAAYVAAHMKALRDRNTLEVAQGDLIGASPLISALYHDEPSVQFLGDLGVTASAVGNHEFDEGYQELLRIQNGGCHPVDGCSPEGRWTGAKFDYLGANVLKTGSVGRGTHDGPALKPWTIRWINGVPVGFIGVVTKTTPSIVTAEGIKGLTFEDEVAAANRSARELKARGVRAIVLLVHEGDQTPAGQRPDACGVVPGAGTRIAREADPEIDVVLAGHTHQQYVCTVPDPNGQPRLYSSGSSFGRVITQVDFKVNRLTRDIVRTSLRGDNHVVTRDVPPDPATEAFVQKWRARVAAKADAPVGKITADLTRAPSPYGETALGDVVADAQLAAMKAQGAQIALMNPGGDRADLVYRASGSEGDGVVTYGEAFAVQPFSNIMQTMTLTGAQLKTVLEQQWQPQPDGSVQVRILQISSTLHYSWSQSAAVGSKVSDITVAGEPVTDDATYRVSVNNFLAAGGDGFAEFANGTDIAGGPVDLDAFTAYLTANQNIAPPAADRITVLP
jgi:5'-nucleotidase